MTVPAFERTGNLFLDALPPATIARLGAKLELWNARVHERVATEGAPVERVVFPRSGVVSAVTTMHDGGTVEIMTIGREGFYGLQLGLGDPISSHHAMIQLAGPMLWMPADDFRRFLSDDRTLVKHVLTYTQTIIVCVSQFAGCNRLHQIDERCARWLLMAHDRSPNDEIFLTHEYLATMLGVRRPGVSLAAAALDAAGLIEYRRGRIVVLDRLGLEAASCECYDAVDAAYRRLLGYSVRKSRSTASLE